MRRDCHERAGEAIPFDEITASFRVSFPVFGRTL